jgi:hypothetical protein
MFTVVHYVADKLNIETAALPINNPTSPPFKRKLD